MDPEEEHRERLARQAADQERLRLAKEKADAEKREREERDRQRRICREQEDLLNAARLAQEKRAREARAERERALSCKPLAERDITDIGGVSIATYGGNPTLDANAKSTVCARRGAGLRRASPATAALASAPMASMSEDSLPPYRPYTGAGVETAPPQYTAKSVKAPDEPGLPPLDDSQPPPYSEKPVYSYDHWPATSVDVDDPPICGRCLERIECDKLKGFSGNACQEGRTYYHSECYARKMVPKCSYCCTPLLADASQGYSGRWGTYEGKNYHEECYDRYAGPRCAKCFNVITANGELSGRIVCANKKMYHEECERERRNAHEKMRQ